MSRLLCIAQRWVVKGLQLLSAWYSHKQQRVCSQRPDLHLVQLALKLTPDTVFVNASVGRQPPSEAAGKMQKQPQPRFHSTNTAVPLASVAWNVLLALFKFGVLGGAVYLLSCDLNVFVKEYIYGVQKPFACPAEDWHL